MAPLVICCFKQRLQMFIFQANLKVGLFRLLFDSGAQLSYVSPKLKAFLNPEIKAKREVILKTFGENMSTKILHQNITSLHQKPLTMILNYKPLLRTSATL